MAGPAGPCGCGCALTPDTSDGFDIDEFARDVLRYPLHPWQRWCAIHGTERLPDGTLRFRVVLLLVARQNGKTTLPAVLSAFWQFIDSVPLVFGTSTKIDYAKEAWLRSVELVESAAALADLHDLRWTRTAHSEVHSWSRRLDADGEPIPGAVGSRYKIGPASRRGGRGLVIHKLIMDELREHDSYAAWAAAVPAGNAVADFQAWALSNAGDDSSVVLNDQRDAAAELIENGNTSNTDTFLAEWSTPEDANPEDAHALAQANPSMNRPGGPSGRVLLSQARTAVAAGGEALTTFKTEVMCVRVRLLNPAIDPGGWARGLEPGELSGVRGRLAACVDLAPDGAHATLLVAAVLDDGRVRVEAVKAWDGPTAADQLRAELPAVLQRVRPKRFGWFPGGPAAELDADLRDRRKSGVHGWPPRGVVVAEIRGEAAAVCMGLAEQVRAGKIVHSGQELLDTQTAGAERFAHGDGWVFSRGDGHVDAVYAMAGAVHLARTMPTPLGKPRLVTAADHD